MSEPSQMSTASKNPYAQRRSEAKSSNAVINHLLTDSTNVAAAAPTRPWPVAGHDDDDLYDDAMIDEYMEYDKDKPPDEYDPFVDVDDDFERVVPTEPTIVNNNTSTNRITTADSLSMEHTSHRAVPVFREEPEPHDENYDSIEMVSSRSHRPKKDCRQFERYVDHTQWRAEKMASPMRAKKWKHRHSNNNLGHEVESAFDTSSGEIKSVPTTAESMVLSFLHQRHDGMTITRKIVPPQRCSLPQKPVVGTTSVPMTLGDGTRVHIPILTNAHAPCGESTRTKQSSSSFGVGIDVLLDRVRMNRRKREYEKVVQASIARSSIVDDVMESDSMTAAKVNPASKSPISVTESSKLCSTSQLWVDKHAPQTFAHLLSDERSNREVVRALRAWDPYVFHREPPKRPDIQSYRKFKDRDSQEKVPDNSVDTEKTKSKDSRPDVSSRVILLSGPPGVGKTTLAHIIARHVGYRPIEVNGSDERTEVALTDRVIRAMESSTLQFESTSSTGKDNLHDRPNCLILDEIDGVDAAKAIQALVEIIRAEIPARNVKKKHQYLRRPIIFICNNKFVPALKPLLPYTKQFDIYPPSTTRLIARLRSILMAEDLSLSAGGNSLLNQLVVSSSGDIRSCLFTLQFAAANAKRSSSSGSVLFREEECGDASWSRTSDISKTLQSTLRGDGLKDVRSDIVGTVTGIFHKEKVLDTFGKSTITRRNSMTMSIDKIFDAVRSFGDNSRMLDCLFMNLHRVSFIDPSFDRCSAVLEWMSSTDCYRSNKQLSSTDGYYVEAIHTPAVAAATHILCRVEQPQDLIYSIRELTDSQYQMESNIAMVQKFLEGVCLRAKITRAGLFQVSTEIVPHMLWILSAGEGSSALNRSVTTVDLLSKSEKDAFQHHAAILQSLGLKHTSLDQEDNRHRHQSRSSTTLVVGLDPPIDRLVKFVDLSNNRLDIPPALKQMLSRKAVIDKSTAPSAEEKPREATGSIKRKAVKDESACNNNFLLMGAKKAKAMRSARSAARVGCIVNDSRPTQSTNGQNAEPTQRIRLSNTGSGLPLSQVVRLKYVKGFTQAVSMPCRLDDIS